MNDGRRRRKAKQARRDARRRAKRDGSVPEDSFLDAMREGLATGCAATLLLTAGQLLEMGKPHWTAKYKREAPEPLDLTRTVTALVEWREPEITVLLAALGELLVDEQELRRLCRREVARRGDPLPDWLSRLARAQVCRVVRMADVLGDRDDLVLGVRLSDGREFVFVVSIDHIRFSAVSEVGVRGDGPMDTVLSLMAVDADPDNRFVEMSAADARAWLDYGMREPLLAFWNDRVSGARAVFEWLRTLMPEGGLQYQSPGADWDATEALLDTFFTSPQGARFASGTDHRELLGELVDSGSGDPLRWSAFRVAYALGMLDVDDVWPGDAVSDAPDLLRAFIPVAHALSGIRADLTERALAAVDEAEPGFRERIAAATRRWDDDEDEDWGWSA